MFLHSENSRFDLGPPVQFLKELENNILVLSDTEISDEDVPVLCRFFNHPEVFIASNCILLRKCRLNSYSNHADLQEHKENPSGPDF